MNAYKGCMHYPTLADCIRSLDSSIEIVIAGKPSEDLSFELLETIRSKPNVRLIDRFIKEDEIDTLFREANLVLMPYTSITQSGVVLDAFSRSRGVVAFAIDGIKEYLPDDCELCKPFDCEEMAKKCVELLQNPARNAAYNRKAWEYGKDRFSPKTMAKGLASVYRELMERDYRAIIRLR